MIVGARLGVEFVELMLREIGDAQTGRARHRALHGREPAGDELDQRRFAVAVGADQGDAVVVVDAQIEAG